MYIGLRTSDVHKTGAGGAGESVMLDRRLDEIADNVEVYYNLEVDNVEDVSISRQRPSTKTRWREGLPNPIKRPKTVRGRHEMSKGEMPHTTD
jgi:hypothetical protein